MYKIKCKDCDCVYTGQTAHTLKTSTKEHTKTIATLDENSLLAKHHILAFSSFLKKATVVTKMSMVTFFTFLFPNDQVEVFILI